MNYFKHCGNIKVLLETNRREIQSCDTMQLEGKNVIYVGGFGGIGEKCVEAFLKSSVKSLLIFDLKCNQELLTQWQRTYKDALVDFIPIDVVRRETIVKAYKLAQDKMGSFDIVVNGAGVLNELNADLAVATNLTGLIHSSLIAMEYMSKMNGGLGGCIVNISSVVGLDPSEMFYIYSATKCGVTAFTRSLASATYFEKTGVSFVMICPGGVDTPMANNVTSKLVVHKYMPNFEEVYKTIEFQPAEVFAQQFINVLRKAQNGTTWVIDGGESHEIQFKPVWHPIILEK